MAASSPGALRVASWNVLADAYVRPDLFPGAASEHLRPGARTRAVLDLARAMDVDVLALQEADQALAAAAAAELTDFTVLWCPKERGRPDGCLTAVRNSVPVTGVRRFAFADGRPPSGHVAHLVTVSVDGTCVLVANTHIRYGEPSDRAHVGVRQVRELLGVTQAYDRVVIAADLNDAPGGPVRTELATAGFTWPHGDTPTSLFDGVELRALDVVAVRGLAAHALPGPCVATDALPGPACPSDHIPVLASVTRVGSTT